MHATAQQKSKRSTRSGSTGADGRDAGPVHDTAQAIAASRWGDRAARVGLGARALVYLVLAYLVARIALGALGHATSHKAASGSGIAQAIAAQPGGRVALCVLAVGLLLYALFSLLDAILHHDDESPAARRWGDRALSAWGLVVYGAFSAYSFMTAFSRQGGTKSAAQQDRQDAQWSARVLRWPAGRLWLGLLGVVLVVIALFLISRAARRSFRPRLDRQAMSRRAWRAALITGTIGYLGRAALFATVGGCILRAAAENDPQSGQGVDGSIRILADSPAGPALLGLLAAALATYGCYMGIESRYRHV